MDSELISADVGVSGRSVSSVECHEGRPTACSRFYRSNYRNALFDAFETFQDKIEDRNIFGMNQERDIDTDETFASARSQIVVFRGSCKSTNHSIFENESNLKNDLLCCNRLSQDDCLNSASHPKLFCSQHQQPWSVRIYKFQVGILNTCEFSVPHSRP